MKTSRLREQAKNGKQELQNFRILKIMQKTSAKKAFCRQKILRSSPSGSPQYMGKNTCFQNDNAEKLKNSRILHFVHFCKLVCLKLISSFKPLVISTYCYLKHYECTIQLDFPKNVVTEIPPRFSHPHTLVRPNKTSRQSLTRNCIKLLSKI